MNIRVTQFEEHQRAQPELARPLAVHDLGRDPFRLVMRRLAAVSVLALALLAAGGCRTRKQLPAVPIEQTTFAPALGVSLATSTRLPSGMYWRDVTVGDGPVVHPGQQVSVHYVGTFPDGEEFDASREGSAPFTFRLGGGEVIRGWDEGVDGMHVGGKRQLVIPPALGYGTEGSGPIPGNAVLVFLVSVVGAR